MKHNYGWVVLVLTVAALVLAGCGVMSPTAGPAAAGETEPAKIEHLQGSNPTRETLTEEAVNRLGIETAAVQEVQLRGTRRMVVPYGAIIYDTNGGTWVYASPAPLTFVRNPVTVDDIQGDRAILVDGPSAGTAVVTVGVAELYGAEFEFQEE